MENMQQGSLVGQVASVTGAGRGIGRAIVRRFCQAGASVVAVARRQEDLDELVGEMEMVGSKIAALAADITQPNSGEQALNLALAKFGRLDILVNNAGIAIYRPIWEQTLEDYDTMMDTNMRGTFIFTKAVVPHMMTARSGTIIMLASMAGTRGFPNESGYCASKFAQVGFSQSLDQELRPYGIKVTAVCPGGVATDLALGTGRTPESVAQADYLQPDEVAHVALMVASQPANSRIMQVLMRPMSEPL